MATAKGHLISGLRGKLGDFVFRYRRGRTYVSKAPVFTQPPSELQVTRRNLFAEAVAFAKAELAIPERRAYYQELTRRRKGHTTAFNMAIKEFMRAHKQQPATHEPAAQPTKVIDQPAAQPNAAARSASTLHIRKLAPPVKPNRPRRAQRRWHKCNHLVQHGATRPLSFADG